MMVEEDESAPHSLCVQNVPGGVGRMKKGKKTSKIKALQIMCLFKDVFSVRFHYSSATGLAFFTGLCFGLIYNI